MCVLNAHKRHIANFVRQAIHLDGSLRHDLLPPSRRVLSAVVQQAVAQLPRCLNSIELTRHDSAQGPSIWCQIGVKGGRFCRFCRFCRLLTTLPSITYVFYSSMAWKRSSVRSRSGPPINQQLSGSASLGSVDLAANFRNPFAKGF